MTVSLQISGSSGVSNFHLPVRSSPDIDSGVERSLGSLLLLGHWIDGGESLLARRVAGGADLLAFRHGECASLIGDETFKLEWTGPRKASLAKSGGSHEG